MQTCVSQSGLDAAAVRGCRRQRLWFCIQSQTFYRRLSLLLSLTSVFSKWAVSLGSQEHPSPSSSGLYNDLPVGLLWFWLWPGSSPNRTHFVLLLCFWHQLFAARLQQLTLLFLTFSHFFLLTSPALCFLPLLLLHWVWSVRPLSFLLTSFPLFWPQAPPPPPSLSTLNRLQERLLAPWCMRAADAHLLPSRRFSEAAIGCWLFTQLRPRWIKTNCHTCCSSCQTSGRGLCWGKTK